MVTPPRRAAYAGGILLRGAVTQDATLRGPDEMTGVAHDLVQVDLPVNNAPDCNERRQVIGTDLPCELGQYFSEGVECVNCCQMKASCIVLDQFQNVVRSHRRLRLRATRVLPISRRNNE
jgi:hypothetical protein